MIDFETRATILQRFAVLVREGRSDPEAMGLQAFKVLRETGACWRDVLTIREGIACYGYAGSGPHQETHPQRYTRLISARLDAATAAELAELAVLGAMPWTERPDRAQAIFARWSEEVGAELQKELKAESEKWTAVAAALPKPRAV